MDSEVQQGEDQYQSDVDDFALASHYEDSNSDDIDHDIGVRQYASIIILTFRKYSHDDPPCSPHSPAQQLAALEAKMHFRGFLKRINITAVPYYDPCLLTYEL
jgi:hypothetical protein